MKKKLSILIILIVAAVGIFAFTACEKPDYTYSKPPITARFMTNYAGSQRTMTSGRTATSENELYMSVDLTVGEKLTAPAVAPVRKGYTFIGWSTDKKGEEIYDFDTVVSAGLNLYAQWQRDETGASEEEEYTEPTLSFTEDKSGTEPFVLKQVCGAFLEADGESVKLTTAGIKRLTANKDNVKELLGYTLNATTTVTSAKYEGGVITVKYSANGGAEVSASVAVVDDTSNRSVVVSYKNDNKETVEDYQYENKAAKYEENYSIGSYGVVLGGSSSMEMWTTSAEDMDGISTINVGIGGTTAKQWADNLAARLIIPYNPRAVVLYVGINDIINAHRTADATVDDLKRLFTVIHTALPETTVHFILINHVPGYYTASRPASVRNYASQIDRANNAIIEYAEDLDYLNIIDAGSCLEMTPGGSYFGGYFRKDGLHMSVAGYTLWGAEVKKAVIAKDKELYSK